MRLAHTSNYEHSFYITDGSATEPWNFDGYERVNARFNRNIDARRRKEVSKLRGYQVTKPDWLLAAERKARGYVRSMGLTAARGTAIYAVDPKTSEEYVDLFDSENYMAHHSPGIGIVVPLSDFERHLEHGGAIGIESTLVHELVHAAEPIGQKIARFYESDATTFLGYHTRQGFIQTVLDDMRGSFLQEGLCNVLAGHYTRRRLGMSDELCSIDDEPMIQKPSFYTEGLAPKRNGAEFGAGYDAYSLEMISWGAWQLGVVASKNTLLEIMTDTHRGDPVKELEALRLVPQIMDQVDPRLYALLRQIDYDIEEWQAGMALTHDAVMSRVNDSR